jgi:hypothetical protein
LSEARFDRADIPPMTVSYGNPPRPGVAIDIGFRYAGPILIGSVDKKRLKAAQAALRATTAIKTTDNYQKYIYVFAHNRNVL